MKFYTFQKVALAAKSVGQRLRFRTGRGFYLIGPPKQVSEFLMFDSVDTTQVPTTAVAVAGYVGGHWPTYATLAAKFPRAHRLSIAVNASEDAECLDVEAGDATIEQASPWVKRQLARGVKRPVVYTSVSQAKTLLDALKASGITRSQVRLWTAHYTYKAHRCTSACGFGFAAVADATQYSNSALGKNLDVSLCVPSFFSPG